jgi:hypothetical protein
MAQIRQYESEKALQGIQPQERGVEAWQMEGRRVGQFYHQIGDEVGGAVKEVGNIVETHDSMQEISKGSADAMTQMDQLTQSWNDTIKNSDPNDPHIAEKWRDEVLEPTLEKFNQGFTTKQSQMWALDHANSMRQHFVEKTMADQSTLAGDAMVANIQTVGNRGSSMVMNDPTALPAVLGLADNSIHAMTTGNPNITADQASRANTELSLNVKKQIVASAVIGAAQRNPDQATALLNSDSAANYLSGEEKKSLSGYINEQGRLSLEAQKSQAEMQRRSDIEDVNGVLAKVEASTIDPNTGDIKVGPDYFTNLGKVLAMPGARDTDTARTIQSMINWGHEQIKQGREPASSDPHVYADFKTRAQLQQGDPRALTLGDVYQAAAEGKLNQHDFTMYKGWVNEAGKNPQRQAQQKILDQFEKGMRGYITSSTMMATNPQQDQRYMEFQQDAQQRFEAGVADGKKPLDLVSPSSSDYIFKDGVQKYQLDMNQSVQSMTERASGTATPLPGVNAKPAVRWKPGMSLDDLDKQLGGK